jgi:hypothetical protein
MFGGNIWSETAARADRENRELTYVLIEAHERIKLLKAQTEEVNLRNELLKKEFRS